MIEVFAPGPRSERNGEIAVSQSPWHRHVSPIYFLLLDVAGLMLGFVAFFLPPEAAHAVVG
jgi:hypothetical protein